MFYKFKNIGTLKNEVIKTNELSKSEIQEFPIGIKLPLAKGNSSKENLFKMNFNIENQIKDNFKFLLTCRKNEMLRNPDYGTNLSVLFNSTNLSLEDLNNLCRKEISSAVNTYMNPEVINSSSYFISLINFSIEKEESQTLENFYILTIEYRISGYSYDDIEIIKKTNNIENADYLMSKINKVIIKFRTSN
jgi:hypothetical protein